MTVSRPYETEPPVLVNGSPSEADRFLVAVLFGDHEDSLPVQYVLTWVKLLHARGDDFASHAATCHYWLYEHHCGYTIHRPSAN
ncbi:hypothetical protein M3I54_32730 [Paraburkholderia sp. CNPSo 3274]|uniref:hypothetical protein n=1 Tax=Paraburkholderia sp. CNPSo 3274 TaxID=2940932 RepID=UPI0020B7E8C0|nr:hypothetical protein [Paraburkholderia sp. CNPSo 3274]MCP3711663.1 hypothetical protein [Paraburkholderia sp. CNPSo 3274]